MGRVILGEPGSPAAVVDRTGGPHHLLDFILPGMGAAAPARAGLSLFRVKGQSGGNGSPLLFTPVRMREAALSSDCTALSLPGGKVWLASFQLRGSGGPGLDSFADGSFTLTPVLDGTPDPLRQVGASFPGGAETVFLSAVLLLPAEKELSLSLAAELVPGGLSRVEGTLALLDMGAL